MDEKRHGVIHVRADFHRRGMVRHHGDADGFRPCLNLIVYRPHDTAVEILYCLDFQPQVAVMSGFVARIHMQENEVVCAQGFDCRLRLSFIIRVGQSGGTLHYDVSQSCIAPDAADEVYGRYHRPTPYLRIHLRHGLHRRTIAAAPWPDGVRHVFAPGAALPVERMTGKQLLRLFCQPVYQVGSLLGRLSLVPSAFGIYVILSFGICLEVIAGLGPCLQFFPFIIEMVVWRSALHVLVSTFYYKQMSVLYSLDEMNVGTAQLLFEPVCQPSALVRSEMATVVVLYPAAFHTDDIAAHGQVTLLKIVADTRRFKGAAPFIYLVLVVTEDAAVCHLTAGQEPVGHGNQSAAASLSRQHIHVWGVGILQRGLSTEPFHPVVCHSVTQDYYVLHS